MLSAFALASAASAAVVVVVAVLDEVAVEQLAQPRVVVDHQDVRRLAVRGSRLAPAPAVGRRTARAGARPDVEQHALEALHRGACALEREPQPPLLQRLDLRQERGGLPVRRERRLRRSCAALSWSISPFPASRFRCRERRLLAHPEGR